MNKLILAMAFAFSFQALASEVGVKVNNINGNEDTTISIEKGKKNNFKRYAISEGEHDLTGDKDVVAKSAETNWKQACNDWKKEFRMDNKDNKIISITCGKMNCTKEGVETTCTSMAKYKIKTLAEE